jgi:hypothetical protein
MSKFKILLELLWAIIAIAIWFYVLQVGNNLISVLTPNYLPLFSYLATNDTNTNFFIRCDIPRDIPTSKTYLERGDLLTCQSWFISENFKELNISSEASLIYPSRNEIRYQSKNVYRYASNYSMRFDRLELNETGLYTFYSGVFIFDIPPVNITLQKQYFILKFNVYDSSEITQRQINQITLFILLITASFGIFTGIKNFRDMVKDAFPTNEGGGEENNP